MAAYFKIVESLFNVPPIDCGGSVFGPFLIYAVLSALSIFAFILMRKRELVALL